MVYGDVIRIKAGETGYYPSTYGRRPAEWVLMENARLGVTVAQAEAMEVCSFSGQWSRFNELAEAFQARLTGPKQ